MNETKYIIVSWFRADKKRLFYATNDSYVGSGSTHYWTKDLKLAHKFTLKEALKEYAHRGVAVDLSYRLVLIRVAQ